MEPYILSIDEMKTWGYIVEVPPGPGGDKPHEEGSIMTCERCKEKFVVKRRDQADQCRFHWGKAFTSKADGMCLPCRYQTAPLTNIPFRREATSLYMLLAHDR